MHAVGLLVGAGEGGSQTGESPGSHSPRSQLDCPGTCMPRPGYKYITGDKAPSQVPRGPAPQHSTPLTTVWTRGNLIGRRVNMVVDPATWVAGLQISRHGPLGMGVMPPVSCSNLALSHSRPAQKHMTVPCMIPSVYCGLWSIVPSVLI